MDDTVLMLRRQLLAAQRRAGSSPYVIVRSRDAGAFAGELIDQEANRATLVNVRRLWFWKGAASLSELAVLGTSLPGECRFPMPAPEIQILDAIEILACTPEARASIEAVPVWTAHPTKAKARLKPVSTKGEG